MTGYSAIGGAASWDGVDRVAAGSTLQIEGAAEVAAVEEDPAAGRHLVDSGKKHSQWKCPPIP